MEGDKCCNFRAPARSGAVLTPIRNHNSYNNNSPVRTARQDRRPFWSYPTGKRAVLAEGAFGPGAFGASKHSVFLTHSPRRSIGSAFCCEGRADGGRAAYVGPDVSLGPRPGGLSVTSFWLSSLGCLCGWHVVLVSAMVTWAGSVVGLAAALTGRWVRTAHSAGHLYCVGELQ